MSAVNPYSPPRAAVADVQDREAEVQPVKFFSTRGRVGRLRYLAYFTCGYFLFMLTSGAIAFAIWEAGVRGGAGPVAGSLVMAPFLIYWVFVSVQRSHDMDWSGWTVLLLLIPFVGLVWIFKGGTPGANRFGAPPPPNTTAIRIGAFIFPAIMFIGILAAIALPAYQQYAMRAKAAQVK